jgi:aspartyl-tRNA(Asn)/glutamyl-tRNA(Gln) amidotransferase subunit A
MDIEAWQNLFRSDRDSVQREFHSRCDRLSSAQKRAVWSYLDPEAFLAPSSLPAAPLHGVPFAVKDLFNYRKAPTRAGSVFLRKTNRHDSRLVAKLRDLGALPVGTTHLHEFAYGLTGGNPHFGNIAHPGHPDHTSGGSSSGSAAVVAAGIVPFALGTDTGGSLRVPAAYCGLFSWRDTPHHPWIQDAYPLAPSFDTAGWLTKTAGDLRRLHHLLVNAEIYQDAPPRGAYLSTAALGASISPHYEATLVAAIAEIQPEIPETCPTFAGLLQGSAVPYGVLQSTEAFAVHQPHFDEKRSHYGEAVWQRIDRGRHWRAAELTYAKVHQLRVKSAFRTFFRDHDYLVMPAAPTPALAHDDNNQANRDALLALTSPASLAGLPAVTVPIFLEDGLSLGLQFIFPSRTHAAIDWLLQRCENSAPLSP